jgi:hypothetical protein
MSTRIKAEATVKGTIILAIIALNAVVGAWLWPYSINTWLEFFGREPAISPIIGILLGFCPLIGKTTVPVAILTWLAMLFIG